MTVIVVSGAIANKPFQGGEAWVRLSWALGFRALGFDVYFVEQISPGTCVDAADRSCSFDKSVNKAYFDQVTTQFRLPAALIDEQVHPVGNDSKNELFELAESAALLVNIGGHLHWPPLFDRFRKTAYIDIDPGFTQFWHLDPANQFRIAEHDWYFTIGENIGRPECSIPTGGIPWLPIRQPVVLEHWPLAPACADGAFTTIANWRGPFGPVQYAGQTFGLKVHEFRKFLELPKRCSVSFELALNIHPDEQRDLNALRANEWRLIDPREAAGTPEKFRTFVQQSAAEFSPAQGIYVDTDSGWFSDRTVRYLAFGKPALVQDTGFGRSVPVGEGLLSFRTMDEAVAGVEAIAADYDLHSRAARNIAEEYFDSHRVLRSMLQQVGLDSDQTAPKATSKTTRAEVGVR